MPQPAALRFAHDEFLDWAQHQEDRCELVGGVPQMMAGAKAEHDMIVLNTLSASRGQFRRTPCRPFTADYAVRIPTGQVRRADSGVGCAPVSLGRLVAEQPRMVVEVLSPSIRGSDVIRKLDDYKSVPGLDYVLLLAPDMPQAMLWSRDGDAWHRSDHDGPEANIPLPGLGIELTMTVIYEDVPFPPRPRLVLDR